MKYLINYADETFLEAQKYCTKTAYKRGGFDKVIEYSPDDIEKEFIEKNKETFVVGDKQIGKYGLWRPHIIYDALQKIKDDDYLCYCDSGAYFIHSINSLVDVMKKDNLYLMPFELPLMEKQWTKRDVFITLYCDTQEITDSNQRMSTIMLIRKCKESMSFFKEYLDTVLAYPFLFTDRENKFGKLNYDCFIQNRHNQSVYSVLTKKYHLKGYKDPSEFARISQLYSYTKGVIYTPCEYMEKYKQIIVSHRRKKVNVFVKFDAFLRRVLSAKAYYNFMKLLRKVRDMLS